MPRTKISKRLKAILALVEPKEILWDMCCDHGELGLCAANLNLADKVYFVDKVPSIIAALNQKIEATDIPQGISLKTICEDSAKFPRKISNSNFILAGIGENTGIEILKQYGFSEDCHLIISTHSDNYEIRRYLKARGLRLFTELIIKDKGKYYEIIKCGFSGPKTISAVGDSMWDPKNPDSLELLRKKISYLEKRVSHQNDEQSKIYLNSLVNIHHNLSYEPLDTL